MKKTVSCLVLQLSLLLCPVQGGAATYYLDSSVPDGHVSSGTPDFTTYNPATFDVVSGSSPVYRTLAELAAKTLVAGDLVYFRRGESWSGKLAFSDSVTYGAFGTGNPPEITGSGSDYAGYANSASNFTVQDMAFSNANYTAVYVFNSYAVANNNTFQRCKFTVTGPVAYGSGTYDLYINPNSYPMSGYLVDSNEMSGGDSGLLLATWGGSPSLSDIRVSNNNIHDVVGSGIKIYAGVSNASATSSPYGIDIDGNTIAHTGYQAIWIMGGLRDVTGHPSYVRNNSATEIGTMTNPNVNAFQLNWLRGTVIDNNTVQNVYTSAPDGNGIFPDVAWGSQSYRSSGVTVSNNRVSGCRASPGRTAGISAGSTSNSQFYHNVSSNNEIGIELVSSQATGNLFQNNVLDGNSYGVMIPQSMYGLGLAPASTWNNNIFSNNSSDGFFYAQGNTPPTESSNLFFGNGMADVWGSTSVYPNSGSFPAASGVLPTSSYYGTSLILSSPETIATIGANYAQVAQNECWLGLYTSGGGTLLAYGKVAPVNGAWTDLTINYAASAGTYEVWTDCNAGWGINYQDGCPNGSYTASGPAYPYPPPAGVTGRSSASSECYAVRATYMASQPLDPTDGGVSSSGPALTVSTLADTAVTNNPTLNVSGTVTANNGVKGLTLDGNEVPVGVDGSFSTVITLLQGVNVVAASATDYAGKMGSDTRSVTLDLAAPTLTVAAPADNSFVTMTPLSITGKVGAATIGSVSTAVGSGSPQPATVTGSLYTALVNLAEGLNTISIVASDLAGNQTAVKRTVTLNTVKPAVAITSPGQDITTDQATYLLEGSVTGPMPVSVAVTVENTTFSPEVGADGTFRQQLTFAGEGSYAVVVLATDAAGNSTTAQRNVIYTEAHSGDVNGDGVVNLQDALLALEIAVGIVTPSADQLRRGDVAPLVAGEPDPDGVINAADALAILEKVVGLITWY